MAPSSRAWRCFVASTAAVGFRALVTLSRAPGVSQLLDLAYRLFAKNRLRLTGQVRRRRVRAAPEAPGRDRTPGLNRGGQDPRLRSCWRDPHGSRQRRRSRAGRAPGRSATALALAGLLAGGGQTTQAKQPAAAAPSTPAAAAAPPSDPIMVVEGGRVDGPDDARERAAGRPDRGRSLGRLAAVRLLGDAREAAAAAAVSDRSGQRAVPLGQRLRARRARTVSSRCSGSSRA